ncbi:MAG TPA: 2-(1,2-epoxy-1,2-dihydrophenyl)acetyl-CoA isomerase PaaG [Gemmatimonadaceae bacterium]|nr:2-(1,2-epoxy-1,2-dihydrophenyl)acetyl-CoA isomerase PaaG [Gemmatimonadaceae bacterium]
MHLIFESDQGVARLTLNRPDVLNSFNRAMARELCEAFAAITSNDHLRAVVLTGAGRAFCAGQDLAEAAPAPDGSLPDLGDFVRQGYNPIIRAIRKLEKPVICAVNGVAAGAGANLALACDIVFASSEASFIQSFSKIGVIPDSGGTFILPRVVGLQRATALTMLADKVTAEQAQEWGMVYRVVEPPALMDVAFTTAVHLAAQPTRGLGLIKRAFNRSLGIDLDEQLDYEEELQREAGRTADYAEGVRAFLAKRKPKFEGR